jgi:hypothetical protein
MADEHGGASTVTVVGSGSVTAEADELTLALAVAAVAESGAEALAGATPRTEALTSLLDELEIPHADRGATGISLGPHHVQESGGWTQRGWQATYQVRVRLRSAEVATVLVAEASERADARVDYANWRLTESHEARTEALRRAIEDAKARAGVIADAVGATLGRLLRVSDRTDRFGAVQVRAGGAAAPQLHAGTIDVATSVELTYALEPR